MSTEPLDEPLRFERHFVEKVWGGRALERKPGIALPADMRVGETWEVVDRENENSVVAAGRFRGRTLSELMAEHAAEILGSAPAGKDGRFPLLVKYLDAASELSVQVHPDERAAATLGRGAEAKTEVWYVIDADADGCLYAGLGDDVERDEFASVADGPGVVDLLRRWEVRAGDSMLVRGGTVHAIGAGVRILEIQQNSDTTYRLYDWGRVGLDGQPRTTHVPEALACVRFGAAVSSPASPEWTEVADGVRRARLASSDLFDLDALCLARPLSADTAGAYRLYATVEATGRLVVPDGRTFPLATADVWLVPARLGAHRLEPDGTELTVLAVAPRSSA